MPEVWKVFEYGHGTHEVAAAGALGMGASLRSPIGSVWGGSGGRADGHVP